MTPVGWELSVATPNPDVEVKPAEGEKPLVGLDDVGGVDEIGGRESMSAAPKDDVGLKAFRLAKPVV